MRLVTAEEVIAMNPCSEYGYDGIRERHGEKGITPKQISELDIPKPDRFWVLIRLVPAKDKPLVAADIAESVLHLYDDKPRKAIEVAQGIRSASSDAANAAHYTAAYAVTVTSAYATAYSVSISDQWDKNFEIVLKYIKG